MIAGLLDDEDDGKGLLDAARDLASAFTNLLKAAQEGGGVDTEVSVLSTWQQVWARWSNSYDVIAWLAIPANKAEFPNLQHTYFPNGYL